MRKDLDFKNWVVRIIQFIMLEHNYFCKIIFGCMSSSSCPSKRNWEF